MFRFDVVTSSILDVLNPYFFLEHTLKQFKRERQRTGTPKEPPQPAPPRTAPVKRSDTPKSEGDLFRVEDFGADVALAFAGL